MTDIDVETGLPKLSDGYFWRLKMEYTIPTLQLRKKAWIGSYEVYGLWVIQYGELNLEDAVLDTARSILRAIARKATRIAAANELIGDYPPKKLGGKA